MRRLSATAIAALLALAAPGAALAQSAGDDQYQDPFAGEEDSQSDTGPAGGGGGSPTPAAPAAPSAPAPVAQPSAAPASTLPYTGLPALLLGGAGAALLAAGVGLRRKTD